MTDEKKTRTLAIRPDAASCSLWCQFLADRTARDMIGYWRPNVICSSICPSVINNCTIVFLADNFLLTSSDTFAAGCMYRLVAKGSEKN